MYLLFRNRLLFQYMIQKRKQSDFAPFRHSTDSKAKVAANKKSPTKPPVTMMIMAGVEDDMEGRNNGQDWIAMMVENIRKATWPYQSLESSQSLCRKEADTATAFQWRTIKVSEDKQSKKSIIYKGSKQPVCELSKCIKTYQIYHALEYMIYMH